MKKKIEKKLTKILIPILVILIFTYIFLVADHIRIKQFAKSNIEIYKNNEEQIFKIEKIVICSSANAIDLSEEQNLENLSIYQYTDIAVYIDNGEELSGKNTVKELYLDNISLEGKENIGSKSLIYKNILNFGLKQEILENRDTSNINFNIIYTNQENETANYDEPTFFTDCSNPVTLQYLNYDLKTNYKMDENKTVSFDGSILQDVGISAEDIYCKVRFKINIVNNEDEKYTCWINFEIPLEDIYNGTTMKSKTTNGSKYVFFREV